MIIIGAKGFAKEVLEVVHQLNQLENLAFYDDLTRDGQKKLYEYFPILTSLKAASIFFESIDNRFTLGIGNPSLRKFMADKFSNIGGMLTSTISPYANIGSFDVEIGLGANVLPGAIFSNGTKLGKGCIVYYNAIITHDCQLGDYVEISPSVTLLGKCRIGSYSQIGANATILPGINIGANVIVGAGAVVTKDVPDNCLVVGMPAVIKKQLIPLNF